ALATRSKVSQCVPSLPRTGLRSAGPIASGARSRTRRLLHARARCDTRSLGATMKQRILFLAANPAGITALKLDEEARAIEEEIRRASQRDAFEFVTRLAARPLDLLRALRDARPAIVHFVGHAKTDG